MDVRIGIAESGQIIEVAVASDTDRAAVKTAIETALDAGTVLWLTDTKGHETAIAASRIAFVEIKNSDADQRIGFGA
ncbi:MAG: hypothetical protein ACI8TP_002890 [Acidimicrobiales bacterium]|jgi:hypothetical protein